jgi:hypothetical protein
MKGLNLVNFGLCISDIFCNYDSFFAITLLINHYHNLISRYSSYSQIRDGFEVFLPKLTSIEGEGDYIIS